MKNLLLLSFLLFAFVSCKKDCEKDKTGTVRITNQRAHDAHVKLHEDWFTPNSLELSPGEIRDVIAKVNFTDPNTEIFMGDGYQITLSYQFETTIPDSLTDWKSIPFRVFQCEVENVVLRD